MEQHHLAPIGTLALAITLAVGALLVAPDARADAPTQRHAVHSATR